MSVLSDYLPILSHEIAVTIIVLHTSAFGCSQDLFWLTPFRLLALMQLHSCIWRHEANSTAMVVLNRLE